MFIIPDEVIQSLSEDGLYDYLTDQEENGNITNDDKEDIYQYFLAYLQDNLDKSSMLELLNGLNNLLKKKSESGY